MSSDISKYSEDQAGISEHLKSLNVRFHVSAVLLCLSKQYVLEQKLQEVGILVDLYSCTPALRLPMDRDYTSVGHQLLPLLTSMSWVVHFMVR